MISAESSVPRQCVVVVGGGIAALECVLALHDLAADRLDVCLVAPDVFFTLPPMAVARPFSRGTTGRLPLDRFMNEHGGRLHTATATRVDAPGASCAATTATTSATTSSSSRSAAAHARPSRMR